MLTKLLCKWLKLMPKLQTIEKLRSLLFEMAYTQATLKAEYNAKKISEWTFYKKLWALRGRLEMLEDIIDTLK